MVESRSGLDLGPFGLGLISGFWIWDRSGSNQARAIRNRAELGRFSPFDSSRTIRGNLARQVTSCPLMCLGIASNRCPSTKFWRGDAAEFAIER